MSSINPIAGLELAQIGWVVPDIYAAINFLANALRIAGFPQPEHIRAQDLGMTYYGQVIAGEWLTTQAYNGVPSSNSFSLFPAKACSMTT